MKQTAAVVIYDDNNLVLLGLRSSRKSIDYGRWETIGGTIEGDETPKACVRREVREELSCELEDLKYFRTYQFMMGDERIHTSLYTGMLKGEPSPNPDEIAAIRWFGRDEIDMIEFAMNCRQRIEDFFKYHKFEDQ